MKQKITLLVMLCLFCINGQAQILFWSDTFEDTGAPLTGTRTPSIAEFSCGGPPATAYFLRTATSGVATQNGTYSAFQGAKVWAVEDIDKGPSCVNNSISANQQVAWNNINIAGKSGLSFKGLFAATNIGSWQGINFGTFQDFLAVEYQIDGGAWTKAIAFYSNVPISSAASSNTLDLDTNGDMIGDGAGLNYVFTEYTANIPGTGATLNLRFNCFANGGNQELSIDNFRLFEAPACVSPIAYTVTGGGSYCAGGSGVVVGLSNSETGVTYQLKNGATNVGTPVSGTGAAISFGNQTTAATYTVVATRTVGACTTTMTGNAIVTVTPLPATPTITPGGSTTFCSGGNVVLTSSSATGNVWSTGATTQSITVSTGGTYTVAVTSGGCTSATSTGTTVTVNPLPATPTITPGGSTTFCSGGNVVLTSSSATGNVWSTGATTQSITVSTGGTYTVAVTSGGCTSATSTGTTVTVNPSPVAGVTQALGILTATQATATYQWYLCPNTLLPGEINQTYTPSIAGDYKVDITLGTCSVTSTCVTVTTLGNAEFELFSKFRLYPNPSNGILNIDSDNNGDILIVNQLGQVVKSHKVNANTANTVNIEELPEGTYFVKGTNGLNISTQKLIIRK